MNPLKLVCRELQNIKIHSTQTIKSIKYEEKHATAPNSLKLKKEKKTIKYSSSALKVQTKEKKNSMDATRY